MKRFKVTFELEDINGDYNAPWGKQYLEQDIQERFAGQNIEIDELLEE